MNKPFIFSSLVFVAGLFGCRATPYQKLGTTLAGGYSEKVMSEDTFYIRFVANNHTSPKVVCSYLYRRAAEVTLRHGFLFFAVIRGPSPLTERMGFYASEDAYDDMDSPVEVDVPQGNRLKMVIQCFGEMPEQRDMRLINAKSYLEWKNSAYEKDYQNTAMKAPSPAFHGLKNIAIYTVTACLQNVTTDTDFARIGS